MQLRSGVPLISDLVQLKRDPFYQDITCYSAEFLQKHSTALAGYGKHWGKDPFKLWSRRWEYPFAAQKVLEFGRTPNGTFKVLDGGSGVTFFPYFICQNLPDARFVCVDSDPSYPPMFEAINSAEGHSRVVFRNGLLQKLEVPDGDLDAICCISVLEHTTNYGEIVREFARVLKRGGLLVLTFDLSLDGKFELAKPVAADLLGHVSEYFSSGNVDWLKELDGMDAHDQVLSTDHVKKVEPEFLPWTSPLAKAVKDLIDGHGWTGGFRSKSVFCLEARRK